jgi:hypothetical protein
MGKKAKIFSFLSPIAQLVERRTVNPQVPGSSPGRGAKFQSRKPGAVVARLRRIRRALASAWRACDETGPVANKKDNVRTITIDRLQAANSEHDLLALVREYLSEWRPEDLAQLPVECRPGKMFDANGLSDFAIDLTRACVAFGVPPEQLRMIEEMDAFVGQACRRMAEIERVGQPDRVETGA